MTALKILVLLNLRILGCEFSVSSFLHSFGQQTVGLEYKETPDQLPVYQSRSFQQFHSGNLSPFHSSLGLASLDLLQVQKQKFNNKLNITIVDIILIPRAHAPFGHQKHQDL